jgi:hypothetical protein
MTDTIPGPAVDAVRHALPAAGIQFVRLLRLVPDPNRPAVGEWSVGETAAHVATSPLYLLAVAQGATEAEGLDEVAADNAAFLAADPERDPTPMESAAILRWRCSVG